MKRLGILLFWWASWLSSEAQNCPELNELKTALNMKDRPFETTDVLQGVQMRFLNCAFVPQSQAIKFEFSFTGTNTKDTDISVREFRAIDMEGNVYEAGNFQFYNNTNHLSKGIVQKAFGEFNNVPRSVRYFKLLKFNFSANDHTYTMQYKDVRISYPDEPKRVVATANESTKHKELIGTWEGRYYQHGGASYEATLIIKSITGNEFEGKMEWLGGHVVIENDNKVYGKIDGSTVTWVVPEGTVVADMILGGKYVDNWTGASLKGKMFGEDKNERGTFSFNNKNYGASNLPSNKINQPLINTSTTSAWLGLWSGQIDSPMLLSLYLNVEQIAGTTFNGYYYHQPPTMPGDKGRPASGTINGNKIRFLIEQNWFEGTLSGNKIAGRGDLRSKNDAVFWLKKGGSTKTANSYEYRGRIVDKKTKTVPSGVVVYYEDLATGENLGQTDVNTQTGEYVLTLPYGKRYGITAKAQGFVASSVSVDLVKPNAKPVLKNTDLYVVPIEAGASINLNNIFFNAGKSNLLPESFAELNRIADFLTENKNIVVEIGGHTDNIGNDQANLTLSQDRADAVSFYLLSKGIQAARLRAKGYGKNRPLAANATEDGKAQNRRVEFVIVKK